MKVAIVPARGGSKRIPRKNVRAFAGKPIIAHSIAAALDSGCFDRVIVSTDDAEIAEVARAHGAELPFIRPPELADDHAGTVPVVQHALRWLEEAGSPATLACCLYATAPFVRPEDLRQGLALLEAGGGDFVFPVTDFGFPIQRALRLGPHDEVAMFDPAAYGLRSQDLEPAFHDAGQFYWGRAAAWLAGRPVFGPGATALRLPRHRVQDIDTPEDWLRAEWLYRALQAEAEARE